MRCIVRVLGLSAGVAIHLLFSNQGLGRDVCGDAEKPCKTANGTYHILLPKTESPKGIVALLHGGGGKGRGLLKSGLAKLSVSRNFIFVAPNGEHPAARFPNNWAVRAKNFEHEKNDIAFLDEVLDDVSVKHGVDRQKALLAGFSRGGSMVWDAACFAPELARAYAPSSGAFWDDLPTRCKGPVDLFHTHGWNDRTVPLEGRPLLWEGVAQGDVFESLRIMRKANGCKSRRPSSTRIDGARWWRHWDKCDAGRIDLMLHPGGHGSPPGWAEITLDWFEARLSEK